MTPSEGEQEAPSGRELVRDGLVTFMCRLLAILAALTMSILTARFLGPAGRGIFVLPTVDAGIAASFLAGLSAATSYFLLNARAGRGAIRTTLIAALPLTLACTALVFALGWVGHHLWASIYAAAFLPPTAIFLVAQGVCYGTKRIRMANYLGVSQSIMLLVAMIAGFLIVGRTPAVAIGAWLISQVFVAGFGIVLIRRYGGSLSHDRASTLSTLSFATRMGGVSMVTLLNYNVDVYMVGLLTTPGVLGMYTLAVSGAQAALSATQSVATTTAPHIGSLSDDDSRELTARAARNNVAIASAAAVLIALLARVLVHLAFGDRFGPVVGALRILLIGIVAMSTSAVLSNYFTLRRGRPELSFFVSSVGAAASIVLSCLLIPRLGINGAAIAVTSSYLLSTTLLVRAFTRESKLPLMTVLLLQAADVRAYRQMLGRLAMSLRRRLHRLAGASS
jgi:O-antigen/teichoic acid export membrane protein